jgi:hypothetical protein
MIIDQVDVSGVRSIETPRDPPIARYGNGPESGHIALQCVQPIPRQRHIGRALSNFETLQYARGFVALISTRTAAVTVLEEQFQAFVPKAPYHP